VARGFDNSPSKTQLYYGKLLPIDYAAIFIHSQKTNQSDLTDVFVSRPQNFGWFLGAGVSRMSGLPTATDIIWDLKRRYYCREENQEISRQDLQSPAIRARIQSFMDSRGFPELWAESEYSTYFEKIFGDNRERQRQYLRGILNEEKVTLTVGNRVLAALLANGFSRMAFTTNFDSVVEKSFAEVSGRNLAAYHLEGATAAKQALANEEFPIYCKLHGDFRYDSVKNLSVDLETQNKDLAECFLTAATRFGFIVAGYSGRDTSVMQLFFEALSRPNPFPHGLVWTGIRGATSMPVVGELIEKATAAGVNANYVEIDTFDAILLRFWRNLPNRPAELDSKVRKSLPATVSIELPSVGTASPLMRMNALPVLAMPTCALAVKSQIPLTWATLRDIQRKADSNFILARDAKVLCWGARPKLEKAFENYNATFEEAEIPALGSPSETSVVKGFLEEGVANALARGKPLLVRRRGFTPILIADSHSQNQNQMLPLKSALGTLSGKIEGLFAPVDQDHPIKEEVFWAEAARVSLSHINSSTWLIVDPDIWIWPPRAREVSEAFLNSRRQNRLNPKFDEILDAWMKVLLGTTMRNIPVDLSAFDFDDPAANPRFKIGSRTGFSKRLIG
jgi:hypothetical protein